MSLLDRKYTKSLFRLVAVGGNAMLRPSADMGETVARCNGARFRSRDPVFIGLVVATLWLH